MTNYCWETSSVVVFNSCCALILQLLFCQLLLSVVVLYSSSVVVPLHISGCEWSVVVLYSVVAVLALLIFIFQQSPSRLMKPKLFYSLTKIYFLKAVTWPLMSIKNSLALSDMFSGFSFNNCWISSLGRSKIEYQPE